MASLILFDDIRHITKYHYDIDYTFNQYSESILSLSIYVCVLWTCIEVYYISSASSGFCSSIWIYYNLTWDIVLGWTMLVASRLWIPSVENFCCQIFASIIFWRSLAFPECISIWFCIKMLHQKTGKFSFVLK